MNRVIKFRLWEPGEQKMYFQVQAGGFDNTVPSVYVERDGVCEWVNATPEGIVMQWTGLKDKNGVEIYEGDILEASEINKTRFKIILYCWGLGGIKQDGTPTLFNAMPYEETMTFDTVPNWLIIGNIHEHPQLLNQGDRKVKT